MSDFHTHSFLWAKLTRCSCVSSLGCCQLVHLLINQTWLTPGADENNAVIRGSAGASGPASEPCAAPFRQAQSPEPGQRAWRYQHSSKRYYSSSESRYVEVPLRSIDENNQDVVVFYSVVNVNRSYDESSVWR